MRQLVSYFVQILTSMKKFRLKVHFCYLHYFPAEGDKASQKQASVVRL